MCVCVCIFVHMYEYLNKFRSSLPLCSACIFHACDCVERAGSSQRCEGTTKARNHVPSSVCMLQTNRPAGGRVSVRHAWLPCFNFPPFENISSDKGREVQRDHWTNRAGLGERERPYAWQKDGQNKWIKGKYEKCETTFSQCRVNEIQTNSTSNVFYRLASLYEAPDEPFTALRIFSSKNVSLFKVHVV